MKVATRRGWARAQKRRTERKREGVDHGHLHNRRRLRRHRSSRHHPCQRHAGGGGNATMKAATIPGRGWARANERKGEGAAHGHPHTNRRRLRRQRGTTGDVHSHRHRRERAHAPTWEAIRRRGRNRSAATPLVRRRARKYLYQAYDPAGLWKVPPRKPLSQAPAIVAWPAAGDPFVPEDRHGLPVFHVGRRSPYRQPSWPAASRQARLVEPGPASRMSSGPAACPLRGFRPSRSRTRLARASARQCRKERRCRRQR